MSQTVKSQHYVWRNYLKRWTDCNNNTTGKVYVLRKSPKGTQASIEYRELTKIGAENYYYDVSGFSEEDKSLFVRLVEDIQKGTYHQLVLYPEVFERAYSEKDFLEKEVMGPHENIDNNGHFLESLANRDYSFFQESPLQKLLNIMRGAGIENPSNPREVASKLSFEGIILICRYVCSLLENNVPDPKRDFMQFFYMQYFRSPRYRENMNAVVDKLRQNAKFSQFLTDIHENFLVNMLSTFFAAKIAFNTMQNFQVSIRLFDNQTHVPFITGDSPIFNLFDVYEGQTSSLMYYPISPEVAVTLYTSKKGNPDRKINLSDEKTVRRFNALLVKNCVNEIYSNDYEYLRSIEKSLAEI